MLVAHLLSFGFVIGVTALADKEALAWMRGQRQTLEPSALQNYHRFVWAGLAALIATGLYLLYPMWQYLLSQPLFIIKMLFVGVLIVNGLLIGRLQNIAANRSYASLRRGEKIQLLASGAISFVSWIAAAAIALYLF